MKDFTVARVIFLVMFTAPRCGAVAPFINLDFFPVDLDGTAVAKLADADVTSAFNKQLTGFADGLGFGAAS